MFDNENPTLFEKSEDRKPSEKDLDDNETEEFDSREIFGKLFEIKLLKHRYYENHFIRFFFKYQI